MYCVVVYAAAAAQCSQPAGSGNSRALNLAESILKHFRTEYEAHIYEKCCPAGAITGDRRKQHVIDPNMCRRCSICKQVRNFNAIEIV